VEGRDHKLRWTRHVHGISVRSLHSTCHVPLWKVRTAKVADWEEAATKWQL
jgi:hypothetical protein